MKVHEKDPRAAVVNLLHQKYFRRSCVFQCYPEESNLHFWEKEIPEIKYFGFSAARTSQHLPSSYTQTHGFPKSKWYRGENYPKSAHLRQHKTLITLWKTAFWIVLRTGRESQPVPLNWKTSNSTWERAAETDPGRQQIWSGYRLHSRVAGEEGILPSTLGQSSAHYPDNAKISLELPALIGFIKPSYVLPIRSCSSRKRAALLAGPMCMPTVTTLTAKRVFILLSR